MNQVNQLNQRPFLPVFALNQRPFPEDPGIRPPRAKERLGRRATIPDRGVGRRKRRLESKG